MSDDFIEIKHTVYSQVKRPLPNPEINSGEEIVEKEGYIPAEVQIMDMINAGKRLGEYRKEHYDYAEDEKVPDDAMAVGYGFVDPVDAQLAMKSVTARLEAQAKAAEESGKVVEPPKAE